jgi:hypothetical protein
MQRGAWDGNDEASSRHLHGRTRLSANATEPTTAILTVFAVGWGAVAIWLAIRLVRARAAATSNHKQSDA